MRIIALVLMIIGMLSLSGCGPLIEHISIGGPPVQCSSIEVSNTRCDSHNTSVQTCSDVSGSYVWTTTQTCPADLNSGSVCKAASATAATCTNGCVYQANGGALWGVQLGQKGCDGTKAVACTTSPAETVTDCSQTASPYCYNGNCVGCLPTCPSPGFEQCGGGPDGCGGTCILDTNGQACSTGDCDTSQCVSSSGEVLLYHIDNKIADGEDATHFHDYSGMGNDGSCSGTSCPTFITEGRYGGAYNFDGVDDNIASINNNLPLGSSARSVSFWIRTTSERSTVILHYGTEVTNQNYYILLYNYDDCGGTNSNTGGVYSIIVGTQGTGSNLCGNNNMADGSWHYVTTTYDGATSRLYLDGQLEDSRLQTPNTVSGALKIGTGWGGLYFNGAIDELTIWNRALTGAEILGSYQQGLPVCGLCKRGSCDNQQCVYT